jgi:hypothetical protein
LGPPAGERVLRGTKQHLVLATNLRPHPVMWLIPFLLIQPAMNALALQPTMQSMGKKVVLFVIDDETGAEIADVMND